MDAQSQWTGLDAGRLDRITDHIERNYIQPQKIAGCQVMVARHGHQAYFRSFGHMDLSRGKAMRDDTIFRIYSMTKPITSVALMQLYEKGLFQLNDPVSRVIPSWKGHRVWVSGDGDQMVTEEPKRPVSFRDMLCHTGGLTYGSMLAMLGAPDSGNPVDKAYATHNVRRGDGQTLEDFVQALSRVPLRYQPGERWQYSVSTDVCGHLIEALSGMPLDEYFQKNIFEPLGMVDTAFDVPDSKLDRFAANYRRGPDKKLQMIDDPQQSAYRKKPTFLSGGGGLVGTTADYHRFTEMLRRGGELDGNRILGPRTLELMHRNHLKGGGDLGTMAIGAFSETAYDGVGFGLGFASTLDEVTSGSLGAGDYYWGGAASTIFWVDPKEDITVVFMTQLIPSATFNFRGQLKSIIYSSIVD